MNKRVFSILIAMLAVTSVTAQADMFLPFTPTAAAGTGLSPEGCFLDPGLAIGQLGGAAPPGDQGVCHSGALGLSETGTTAGHTLGAPSLFTSPPFEKAIELAGPASVHVHYVEDTGVDNTVLHDGLGYTLYDVPTVGLEVPIASGYIRELRDDRSANYAGQTGSFDVGYRTIAAGHSLRLEMVAYIYAAPTGRLLYGGRPLSREVPSLDAALSPANFEDAGLLLATLSGGGEALDTASGGDAADSGGATSGTLLLSLLGAAMARRRKQNASP